MQISIITLSLIFSILGISPVEAGELPAREPLDALWKQHMLEGDANTSVHIEIRNGLAHKSEEPAKRAKAIVRATTHFADPKIVAEVSRGLGDAMHGIETSKLAEGELLQTRGW